MNSVRIKEVPFNADNLAREHTCALCRSKLVSAIDIDLKKMLYKKQVSAAKPLQPVGV